MAISDKPQALKPVIWQDRAFHLLQGEYKCGGIMPTEPQRVWYQRTMTGGPTIYLFSRRPKQPVRFSYSASAFGWIPEEVAKDIWLSEREGWCNFWPVACDIAEWVASLPLGKPYDVDCDSWVEFTDNIVYSKSPGASMQTYEAMLDKLGKETDFKRQAQHWALPVALALAASGGQQGGPMGNFDPYAAQADQLNRLSKGAKVSNLQARCATVVDQTVSNNKTAAAAAAYLEAGRIANNQLVKFTAKSLPAMVRGYADTPVGKLVTANLVVAAAQHFKPGNKQLAKLSEAMLAQAYAEVYANLKIEDLLDSFLGDSKIQEALTKVGD